MLELIGKMKEIEMFDPLPSDEKRYAARMLRNVESAIKSKDAPAAVLFMLEWAENFYDESIAVGEITPGEAESIFRSLTAQAKITELSELEKRIETLESKT